MATAVFSVSFARFYDRVLFLTVVIVSFFGQSVDDATLLQWCGWSRHFLSKLSFDPPFGPFVYPVVLHGGAFVNSERIFKESFINDAEENSEVRALDESDEFLEPSSIAATIPSIVILASTLPSDLKLRPRSISKKTENAKSKLQNWWRKTKRAQNNGADFTITHREWKVDVNTWLEHWRTQCPHKFGILEMAVSCDCFGMNGKNEMLIWAKIKDAPTLHSTIVTDKSNYNLRPCQSTNHGA